MRALVQEPWRWALALALAISAAGRPAAAQRVVIQADGALNVGVTQTTQDAFQADPMAEPGDVLATSTSTFFTEIRPGIALQSGSPRLAWRLGYQFSSNFLFGDSQTAAYSNSADLALIGQTTKYTVTTVSGTFSQGGTSFLLSQRPAETGSPEIRAPGNPNLLSVTLAEALTWQAGERLSLQQGLSGAMNAPQDDLGAYNASLSGTLGLDRQFRRDSAGLEARSSISWLRPLQADLAPYKSLTNALVARWNHDFSWRWNGLVTGGVEQVFTDTGSEPLAVLPTGSLSLRYTVGNWLAGVEFSHGSATNLQVGSVSISDRITARGAITLDAAKLRAVSFSAGFLHNEPLGDASALVAAGTGNAVQGDVGFNTGINKNVFLSARYSLAYQYGQGGGIGATLAHIFTAGVIARYSNTAKVTRPMPVRGRRVDGTDGKPFPVSEDLPPTPP